MYELDWSIKPDHKIPICHSDKEGFIKKNIHRTALLRWEEHCLECIVPECHKSCKLYVSRSDGSCGRFVYGIVQNKNFKGTLQWGAEILFRPWAKLETGLFLCPVSPVVHNCINAMDKIFSRTCKWLFELAPRSVAYGLHWRYTAVKNRFLSLLSNLYTGKYDSFVIECFSRNEQSFNLVLEHRYHGKPRYRDSFLIKPGMNLYIVPVRNFGRLRSGRKSRLAIYPENNAEVRLVFTCLDLITWKKNLSRLTDQKNTRRSDKVKCIAWDLDNTLWKGILIEDGPENLVLRQEAETAIRELDRRGIIHTIVSKNNHDQAWAVVERMGLQDYFIYPAVNWASKSSNIDQIAKRLNIGIDSIAFIDDSEFEREEVKHRHPEIRVYSENDIDNLVSKPEFDVPVTEMSIMRRTSYLTQIQREHALEIFSGDYPDFLRSCGMKMKIFIPRRENHVQRCLELIQRTNQLNLSGRTYCLDEFETLVKTEGMLCVALECSDKFGNYGIVGFASIDERQDPVRLVDFVISCRVAQKRVEYVFIKWLSDRQRNCKKRFLEVKLVKSNRNGPLQKVFYELPFNKIEENSETVLMKLPLDKPLAKEDIVHLTADMDTEDNSSNINSN